VQLLDLARALVEEESGRRVHPLRAQAEIIVVPLVAEKEVLVAPERGAQLRLEHDLRDQLLLASEACWGVHGVDLVQDFTCLDAA